MLPIVIANAYSEETLRARFKSIDRIAFLKKPYSAEHL
jgi:hypothetical protein